MFRFLIISVLIPFLSTTAYSYEAHEWGTFTSLVGSDGLTQHGMYHEDEPLPDFVHGFGETQSLPLPIPPTFDCEFISKFCMSPQVLQNNIISQKMETPVIYFYGDQEERVRVDVDFPEGIITDTYPAPVSSFPKNSENLLIAKGSAQFVVDLLKPTPFLQPPVVGEGSLYGHARNTESLLVKTNNEVEKFIFYRGLGRFQPQIYMTSERSNLTVQVPDDHRPQSAFLVYVEEGTEPQLVQFLGPHATSIPQAKANGGATIFFKDETIDKLKTGGFSSGVEANKKLVNALVESGLFKDEARAMVDTWEHGYFKVPGLRILYILPKKEVDSILPLQMSPAPSHLERSFVARIEVMLEDEELNLVAKIMMDRMQFDISALGRFAEPRLRRAHQVYIEQSFMENPDLKIVYGLGGVFEKLIAISAASEGLPLQQ